MNADMALVLCSDMMWTAIKLCAPILGLTMLVGVLISVVQVVTQIQEMSLAFVPKLLVVALGLIFLGPWMLRVVVDFAKNNISAIPGMF